jgi:lysine decarboxylase
VDRIESMMSMLLTSSPSYLMMASIEASIDMMDREGNDRLKKNMAYVEKMALKYPNAGKIFKNKDYFMARGVNDFDNTRLLFKSSDLSIKGGDAESILRKEYNIQVEMADSNYINAFMTVCDEIEDIERLFKAVEDMALKYGRKVENAKDLKESESSEYLIKKCPESVINIRKAFYSEKLTVDIKEAKGKISGNYIIPYPPGIPLLCPGEKITDQMVGKILEIWESNIEVIGLNEGKIEIINI